MVMVMNVIITRRSFLINDVHLSHHLAHGDGVHGELPVALPRHRHIGEVALVGVGHQDQIHMYKVIFSLVPSIKKLINARLGVSRPIYVNVDSPNLGFPYFLGEDQ